MKKSRILVLHGPNLNLLGEREPEIYGKLTLRELNALLKKEVRSLPVELTFFQSNCEGLLIDQLHRARRWAAGIVFNPGAYTHYSLALRDAVAGIQVPTVEVHLSKISEREAFRRVSVIAEVCVAQVEGLGWRSYLEGIHVLLRK